MVARNKFEPLEIRPVRLIALMYVVVLLCIGALLAIWTLDTYQQILRLDEFRNILDHGELLWFAIILPLGIFGWAFMFPRAFLDFVTGRPLARLSREGLTARSGGVFAGSRSVAWHDITSIGDSRASGRTLTLSAFLPFRIAVHYEHRARSPGVIVGGHRKQHEQTVKGVIKIPTSYANLRGPEIKHLLDRFHREFGDPATFPESVSQSVEQPVHQFDRWGYSFPQHNVHKQAPAI